MSGGGFDLEAEVHDLAARRDIMAACQRYMRGQDRLLPEVQRSAFHSDARVNCGLFEGDAAGFTGFAQGFLGACKGSQHLIGQHSIDVTGDRATGEAYFIAWHRIVEEGADKDLLVAGRYVDVYERRDGQWRIAQRDELIDWARTDPAADGFLAEHAGKLLRGAHGAADLSVTRPA